MIELPAELRMPPPRPAEAAGHFLAKTKKTARGMIFGGAALFPLVVAIFYVNFGDLNGTTVLISAGISGLVELMGAALLINARKSLQLFTEGTATMGRVRKATKAETMLMLEVDFTGGGGTSQVAKVVVLAAENETLREGEGVPVLYSLNDLKRCAIYTPKLGMMAGVIG